DVPEWSATATVGPSCAATCHSGLPAVGSQTHNCPSAVPPAKVVPPADMARPFTAATGPASVRMTLPSAMETTGTVPSAHAAQTVRPSMVMTRARNVAACGGNCRGAVGNCQYFSTPSSPPVNMTAPIAPVGCATTAVTGAE